MNHLHRSPSCQPCRPVPAPGSALDDALLEIRSRLGYAPQRLYETTNGRPIRFGRGKSVPGWAFVRYVNGTWVVYFGDWRTQEQHRWTSHGQHELPAAERRRLEEDVRRLLNEERLKQEDQRAAAARSVQAQWENLPPAPADHPYLVRKGVQPHGLRARADVLLVPLRDAEWNVWNLQLIQPDGGKRFLKGGRVSGLFHPFGTHEDFGRGKAILVCEGWATGATLREATGLPVAAAMNCGNLLPAARALREKFPRQKLVICADDDGKTPGNPGVTKAEDAACCVGAAVAIPVWTGARGEKDSDFNDLARAEGCDAVRRIVEAVLKAPGKAAPGPEKAEDKAPGKGNALRQSPRPGENERSVPAVEPAGQDAGGMPFVSQPVRPGLDERPCYWLLEEPAVIGGRRYDAGVYHCGIKHEKQFGEVVPAPTETWLSSPIRLLARTIEWPDGAQGVRLAVWDGRGWRDVVLPREALASRRYREILYARGAQLTPENRPELAGYLQQDTASREYVTSRAGWHGEQYVLPDTTIGRGPTISFTGLRATDEPLTAGGLEDWRRSVAALSAGNPLLVFAISLAFAGPLLKLTERNAVLVHLVGRSTTGKTTCLLAANSVVGPPELTTTWRATADGLEQRALSHCDGFLGLDEIGQVEPRVLDHAIYVLANGVAKQRAQAYEHGVGAAPSQRWRVAVLSSGEKTIETLLAVDGRSVNAGQAVRFTEIPVEERYGAFLELHGYESGAAFADSLRRAVRRYYGTPIRAFLEQLSGEDRDALDQKLDTYTARLRAVVNNSDAAPGAQASRVLTSMALVAAAGELATAYGITGWREGEAFRAALHCYRLWGGRGTTGTDFETTSLLCQVYDFITRHGDSRFSPVGNDIPGGEAGTVRVSNHAVHHRAGYYRDLKNGDREYLLTHDGIREATRGFDFRHAWQELLRIGALIPGRDHVSQSVRVGPGQARVRVYVVSFHALNRALEQIEGSEG
jgi:putative DNA primase/helicase